MSVQNRGINDEVKEGIRYFSKNNRYEKEDELNWSNRMRSLGYEGELFLLYIN